ncbi:MAG: hypothetical protein R3F62_24435 [Planctomycetota bacterium]
MSSEPDALPPFDPYAVSPAGRSQPPPAHAGSVLLRRRHGPDEAAVRAVGWALCALGLALCASAGLDAARERGTPALLLLSAIVLGAGFVRAGLGLRALEPLARREGIVASALCLLALPVGPILGLYALSTLLGRDGALLFSPDYAAAIAATPEERPRLRPRAALAIWGPCACLLACVGLYSALMELA